MGRRRLAAAGTLALALARLPPGAFARPAFEGPPLERECAAARADPRAWRAAGEADGGGSGGLASLHLMQVGLRAPRAKAPAGEKQLPRPGSSRERAAALAAPETSGPAQPRRSAFQSNDPFAVWLREASSALGRLRRSLAAALGLSGDGPADLPALSAVQTGSRLVERGPPSANRTEATPKAEIQVESTLNDVITIAPGVVTSCILVSLIATLLRELCQGDGATADPRAKLMEGGASAPSTLAGFSRINGTSGPQTAFNICKNIVGEGMLSLPAAVAAGTGLMGSIVIALGFCLVLGFTFSLMGRVCHATGGMTHKECAERSSGPRMAQVMAVTLMLKTVGSCLSYSIVISESFSRILHFFGFTGIFTSRQAVLLGLMAFVLVPLCLLKDLSVLSYTSLLGLCMEFFVVGFMQLRYLDGSYAPGGKYYAFIAEKYVPDFEDGVNHWGMSITTFVLLGMLSQAYIAHYNAPKFFVQMRTRTVAQFNASIALAFIFSLMIYVWVMAVGYLTFGNAADGLILNNYSEADLGAALARIAIGLAVVFGFPLAFTALRDSTISVLDMDRDSDVVFKVVTFGLLAPIALLSCFVHDLGFVNSFMGAFFGGLIVLCFPGLLTYFAGTNTPGGRLEFSKFETQTAVLLMLFGVVMSTLGSAIVIIKKFAPELLHPHG